MYETLKDVFSDPKKDEEKEKPKDNNSDKLELFNKKMGSQVLGTNLRLVASAVTSERALQILSELESSFHQFEDTKGNQLVFKRQSGGSKKSAIKDFSFREFSEAQTMPLSVAEIATMIHMTAAGVES